MSREKIDRILDKNRDDKEKNEESSFGLWGTIERVRIYCNRDDVVRIRSEAGEYTEVEFIIDRLINSEIKKETDETDEETIQGNDN